MNLGAETDSGGGPETSIADLLKVGTDRVCQAGDTLFMQGDPFEALIYIVSGHAKLVSITQTGEALWIGSVGSGQFIGETAFFSGSDHTYEATAETVMKIISISSTRLVETLRRHPQLNAIIAAELAKQHNRLVQHHTEAATLSVRGRIHLELIRLSIENGLDPSQHIIRPVPVFSKLADQLGTSRETVSRAISALQKKGIIQRVPGAIIVKRLAELKSSIS
ncbi:MAG: Crp/Fnr family transcriptional regulator [Pseudomonadota bacterium]